MTSPPRIMRALAVAIASLLLLAAPAQADILLEFDRLISGVEGSVRTIGDVQVEPDLIGQTCQVSVIGKNQASVHPGNDLIVSTGGSSAVVVGVEDEVDAGINHTSQLVLGSSIVVQLRFGPDELSSLGFSLSFDCTQPVTTTTTTPNSTVATAPSCTDGAPIGGAGVTTVTNPGEGSAADTGPDRSDCAPASCTDDGSVVASTAPTDGGSAVACPELPSNRASTTTTPPDTSTTAPPTTTFPTTMTTGVSSTTTAVSSTTTTGSAGSATAALPVSPAASAIAAAPAYAG